MVKFTPYEINLCLYDRERTNKFSQAIKKVVKKGDVVVDAGSGTGILGLLAAKAGASKVYCIEIQPRFAEIIRKNAKINKLSGKIVALRRDASKIKIPEKVDVVMCELLSTGLFFEPETEIMNHLRGYLKKGGRMIPERCDSWIQIVKAQKSMYSLHLDYDSRSEKLHDIGLTDKVHFDELSFSKKREPLVVDTRAVLTCRKNGEANAVRITSKAKLCDGVYTKQSRFLFNPLIIYLKKPAKLRKGKKYEVHIRYRKGEDTLGTILRVKEI